MEKLIARRGGAVPGPIAARLGTVEMRGGLPLGGDQGGLPSQHGWFRLDATLEPVLARVALAYASDFGLISTAIIPHGMSWFSQDIQGASLDHAIWFHEDPPLGEWLLYTMDSPWSGHARGFTRGSVYDRSGRLIASMAQEGLMRHRPQPHA